MDDQYLERNVGQLWESSSFTLMDSRTEDDDDDDDGYYYINSAHLLSSFMAYLRTLSDVRNVTWDIEQINHFKCLWNVVSYTSELGINYRFNNFMKVTDIINNIFK